MKLKKIIIFALLAITANIYGQSPTNYADQTVEAKGQTIFIIDDFSDKYSGKIIIIEGDKVQFEGVDLDNSCWIVIFDKKTYQEFLKIQAYWDFSGDEYDGKAPVKLPYSEQDYIIYGDFNFDGKKDFAINYGNFGPYMSAAYFIYLATDKGFEYSEVFTDLQGMGMFHVDYDTKQITSCAKSGCCIHWCSVYTVENNTPVRIKYVLEQSNENGVMMDIEEEKRRLNGEMVRQKYSIFEAESFEEYVVYSFEFSNKKKMRLVCANMGEYGEDKLTLLYIFTDKDNKVELYTTLDNNFYYSKKDNSLEFKNGKTTYKITSSGIIITTPSKKYDMKAVPETIKGSLAAILKKNFKNLVIVE